MKYLWKINPVPIFDIDGLSHWLSDMARQGFHLVKLGQSSSRFRRGSPEAGIRYGLEAAGFYDIDRDRNAIYQEMGWTYVTTLPNLYYVYRTTDPHAPPLHTDPVTQSEALRPLIRRIRRFQFFTVLWLIFCFRKPMATWITQPWLLPQHLVLRSGLFFSLLILLAGCFLLYMFPQRLMLRGLKRLQAQLADGITPGKDRKYPRHATLVILNWCATFILLFSPFLAVFLDIQAERELNGPSDWTFPHVTLQQAFSQGQTPDIRLYTPQMMTRHDTVRSSFLCPEQYD